MGFSPRKAVRRKSKELFGQGKAHQSEPVDELRVGCAVVLFLWCLVFVDCWVFGFRACSGRRRQWS